MDAGIPLVPSFHFVVLEIIEAALRPRCTFYSFELALRGHYTGVL